MNAQDLSTPPRTRSSRRPLLGRALVVLSLAAVWGCTASATTNPPSSPTGDDGDDAAAPVPDAGNPVKGGALGFTPSNNVASALAGVDLSMLIDIDVVNADEQLHVDCAGQGNMGCIEATVMQSDGSSLEVYVANSWKIEPAGVLNVTDKTPVALVGIDSISVLGEINLHATGAQTVAGGFTGTTDGSAGGPGKGAPGVTAVDNVNTGIAGGGGSFCGAGGASGMATATNGGAGKTYGTPTLVPLVGGSAGGPGSLFPGAGGGAVQLVAGTSVTVSASGSIFAGGGAGYDGTDSGGYVANGGGSGGAVLIEAPTVAIGGIIAANGGGGGGGKGGTLDALDAANSATAAAGGQPGTTGAGGIGSAGATVTGAAGGPGDAVGGNYSPGAGGGGAGYIRINTSSGAPTVTATLSPATGTACVSVGPLAH